MHIKKIFISVIVFPINITDVRNLINIIIPYSLMKIRANSPPPYSILNPDTISDSPSAISKGVRLDSAIHKVSHIILVGREKYMAHIFSCISLKDSMEKDFHTYIITNINSMRHTSYEMICATARCPPIIAYFEFLPHLIRMKP